MTRKGNNSTVNAASGSWSTSIPFEAGAHKVEVFPWDPDLGSLPEPSVTRNFTVNAGSQYAASGVVSHTYDGAGYLIKRTYADGRVREFHWDVQGRLLKVTERNGAGNGWDWLQVYDPMGRRLSTTYVPVTGHIATYTQAKDTKSYFDPEVAYLEIGVRRWGYGLTDETLWKFYGPDLSDAYGGLQGIGGLEAVWNEATGELWQTLNDSVGDLVSHMRWNGSSYTHTAITTEVTSYGPSNTDAAAGSAWATTNSTKLIDATFWRGYRIDPTGLYWMGARYYDPQGGRFISPDPLGHAASEDLYSYAGGDPVNYVDPLGLAPQETGPATVNPTAAPVTIEELKVHYDQLKQLDDAYKSEHSWWHNLWNDSPYEVEMRAMEAVVSLIGAAIMVHNLTNPDHPIDARDLDYNSEVARQLYHLGATLQYAAVSVAAEGWIAFSGLVAKLPTTAIARSGALAARSPTSQSIAAEGASSQILRTSTQQLQSKFKHAADFGIQGNYNAANGAAFRSAINQHINSPGVQVIQGTYRGTPVTHYVNPQTGLNVMSNSAGEFLSGWRLSPQQLQHVTTTGKLGGG